MTMTVLIPEFNISTLPDITVVCGRNQSRKTLFVTYLVAKMLEADQDLTVLYFTRTDIGERPVSPRFVLFEYAGLTKETALTMADEFVEKQSGKSLVVFDDWVTMEGSELTLPTRLSYFAQHNCRVVFVTLVASRFDMTTGEIRHLPLAREADLVLGVSPSSRHCLRVDCLKSRWMDLPTNSIEIFPALAEAPILVTTGPLKDYVAFRRALQIHLKQEDYQKDEIDPAVVRMIVGLWEKHFGEFLEDLDITGFTYGPARWSLSVTYYKDGNVQIHYREGELSSPELPKSRVWTTTEKADVR